ncbi:hypothetical protein AFLA_013927 [Aspergillus flavus NRRL3357]|nr:hypothetical protein AFLA_013927 [Aspergillus flavus NRRL3357]
MISYLVTTLNPTLSQQRAGDPTEAMIILRKSPSLLHFCRITRLVEEGHDPSSRAWRHKSSLSVKILIIQLKVVEERRVKKKLSLSASGVLRPRAQLTRNEGFLFFLGY